jgi:hypothetical protein
MTTVTNGQARRSLGDQIDRLDKILDCLANGLNEAVAHAVEQSVEKAVSVAVREAVQAVLTELLTNPDLRGALAAAVAGRPTTSDHATSAARASDRPRGLLSRAWGRLLAGLSVVRGAVGRGFSAMRGAIGRCFSAIAGCRALVGNAWSIAARHKWRVFSACGIGLLVGVVVYLAGPWLAAFAGWVWGFTATLVVQARDGLKRLAGST